MSVSEVYYHCTCVSNGAYCTAEQLIVRILLGDKAMPICYIE